MLLKFLRKRKNMKRIIWGLALLIIPAFVMWGAGTSSRRKGKGPDYAGKIFNRKVSFEEYVDMWRIVRDYVTKSFGGNVPPEFIDQLAWSRILLLEGSKREDIVIKDSEVVERIASFPVFQREGSFDKKLYKSTLGDSVRGFEERLRDDMRISKLREKITSHISITDEEIREEYKKKFEKIKASYISIPFKDFEKDVRYKEPELIEYYENNKEIFRQPEEINVKYIEILFSDFEKEIYIEEASIERYFEEHLPDFEKPDSDETPVLNDEIKKEISERLSAQRKVALAEELAYKVLDKALDKKDLDETVRFFALETKETGLFSAQQEIPGIGWSYEFTKKGFELEIGKISDVLVKTDKGFYIIQLHQREESYIAGFIEARDSVINAYIKNKSRQFAEKNAKKLTFRHAKTLEGLAGQAGLEVKQTDFITRDGYIPLLGPAREFVEKAVSLKTGEIGGPVKMSETWVILQIDEYEDIDEVKFLEEKKDFKETVLSRKKQKAFDKWLGGFKKDSDFVSYTSD